MFCTRMVTEMVVNSSQIPNGMQHAEASLKTVNDVELNLHQPALPSNKSLCTSSVTCRYLADSFVEDCQ